MALLEPTNLLLLSCALLYGLIGEPGEAAILLVFVLAISLLDALQQRRSRRALAELARLSAPLARVERDGQKLLLPPEEVRLGDRLRLEEGDRVAADAQLEEATGLWLDESLLTGESLPVLRQESGAPILAGSLVAAGERCRGSHGAGPPGPQPGHRHGAADPAAAPHPPPHHPPDRGGLGALRLSWRAAGTVGGRLGRRPAGLPRPGAGGAAQ
jgi:hypothetical protein